MQWKRLRPLWLFALLLIVACSTVPITGRQQLNLIPQESILSMSSQQYDQFLDQHDVIRNTEAAQVVEEVGKNIAAAVERYMQEHNMSQQIADYNWEFNLVKDDQINAFAMPGGKVVVYSGILDVAKSRAGLATVMSHEIAHVIANHGSERMSQGLLAQFGGVALAQALQTKPAATQQLFMTAYGLGAQVGVLLPYSRLQESEADRLGLIFMAMAGYDPREAVDFWKRMAAAKQGAQPPEFLSTHPADQTRIKNLEKLLPEAMKYYNSNGTEQRNNETNGSVLPIFRRN